MKEKTYVEDIDRSIYDVKDEERDAYKVDEGLTEAIVEQISREKKDPPWMELFRLQALQIYNEMPVPDWGPSIEGLDMSHIVTYVRPNTKMTAKWSDVPQDTDRVLLQLRSHLPRNAPEHPDNVYKTRIHPPACHHLHT